MTESRSRITLCDGEVVTFAKTFTEDRDGPFGPSNDAKGPFEISASRNAVCVHNADLKSDEAIQAFVDALWEAREVAARLSREGFGGNFRTGVGKDVAR